MMKSCLSNIQFVVQPIAKGNKEFFDEEEKFQEKLVQLSENIYSCNLNDAPPPVKALQQHRISDCAVGPEHLAFLLEDGRVCRLWYNANTKPSQQLKTPEDDHKDVTSQSKASQASKSMRTGDDSPWNLNNTNFLNMGGAVSWTRWGNRIGVIRSTSSTAAGSSSTSTSSSRKTARMSQHSAPIPGANIRLIRSGQVRGRNIPLLTGSQRVMVPASQVPEDLINQVQGVLQGKSRNVIVRELQRTNLDVNLAVNNLLSRDDEDNDELDDAGDYIPGEELMSLLDGGMHPGDHPRVVIDADSMLSEDLLGYSFSRGPSSRGLGGTGAERGADPEDDARMSSPHWIDLFRRIDAKRQSKTVVAPLPGSSGISLGQELEWWEENGEPVHFNLIGAMHSELVGVDTSGVLRQWKWKDVTPFCQDSVYHPSYESLCLPNKKITLLSTCSLRASVVTQGGATATWMDESVASYTRSLHQPMTLNDAIESERVKSLHVCSLYSAILTQQGNIYWWGVPPFNQRKKLLEKAQNSLLQNLCKDNGAKSEPVVGSTVCLRHFPIYQAGTIAVNISSGSPKVGKLLESAWNLEKSCRFQIINGKEHLKETQDKEAVLLQQMQSPSNSDEKSLSESSKPQKRKREDDEDDKRDEDQDAKEEEWDLKEVVFIEDVRSVSVGKVTKIDGSIVAVDFSSEDSKQKESSAGASSSSSSSSSGGVGASDSASSLLNSCRLLHKDDIVVVKPSSPHVVDCIQKQAKKMTIHCDPKLQLHCITATTTGIVSVASKPGGKVSYISSLGKQPVQKVLPTSPESFMAVEVTKEQNGSKQPSIISPPKCKLLHCDQASPTLLQDYNAMLYPLLADENEGIRDPLWADIPPLLASAMGIHSTSPQGTRCTVTVLAFQNQVLMPLVMQRDFPAFESIVKWVEGKHPTAWAYIFCKSLLTERCDGQRNLLHMCIEMSIPSSNKEQKEDEKEKEARNKPKYFDNAAPSVSSAASKPPPLPPPPVTEAGVFMSDDDRAHAVNAIANVLSTVTRGHIGASSGEMPIPTVGRYVPSQPPGIELPPSSSSSTSAAASRRPVRDDPTSSSTLGHGESPLLPWPPEMKSMDTQSEEEGMNLSMSSAEKKSARRSQSSSTTPTSSSSQWTEVKEGGKARGTRYDAVSILELICKSKASQPSIKTLLTQKDAAGCTPFMFAVAHRAYVAALVIFNAALDISKEQESSMEGDEGRQQIAEESLLSMIYPRDSDPDYNPLYMLCCNDNCSFTWTGAQHINQDIFECLTCGLTETLCCCSECARVCHKGHECKLKRTSPTAYCDCWEKCACKSLVSGDAADRIALLRNLLHLTQLYEVCDSGGQHILQFLIQTVARQVEEQRQWRPRTARMSAPGARPHRVPRPSGKEPTQGGDQDMPEHDLHPPRFCREALLLLLGDWKAVRSLVLTGSESRRDELSMSSRLDARNGTPTMVPLLPEDEQLLRQQSGTARLDQFTHTLLVKCASYEYLDKLLETLIHTVQLNKGSAKSEGVLVARRFLRSVIRVYVILTAQSTPDRMSAKSSFYNQPTSKCTRAFLALTPIAIEELCELAESLIAPVRMGVARPTTSFQLLASNADVVHGSTAAFSRQPFPPRSAPSDDDDDPSGRPGTSGLGGTDPGKSHSLKRKKAKKRSKRITVLSHRYGSGRRRHAPGGADEGAHEEEDQHQPDPPQDTQDTQETQGTDEPVEDDPLGDSDHNESDMDLTDIEIIAETDSDSVASGDSDQGQESEIEQGQIGRVVSNDQADIRRIGNNDPSQERDLVEEEDEYDTEPMADDPREAKTPTNQQPHPHQEDEDTDSDHYQWQEEGHLERQPTRQLRTESRQTPHTMQWAMGGSAMAPSKPPRPSGSAPGGGRGNPLATGSSSNSGGILYVDRRSMRRSENLENAYINSILDRRYAAERINRSEEPQVNSAAVTNAQLARLFAACVREVSHLLSILRKGDYLSEAPLNTVLEVSFQEWKRLQGFVRSFLAPTWSWLLSVVESTEYQLRYGQVLSMASNPSHRDHPHYNGKAGHHSTNRRSTGRHHAGSGAGSDAARQDFLGYALSLMRARSDEHSDLLPMVDVMALQHVAYVLDAYVYYLRGCSYRDGDSKSGISGARGQISLDIGYDNSENEEDEDDDFSYNDNFYSVLVQSSDPPPLGTGTSPAAPAGPMTDEDLNHFAQPQGTFFRRSESMTFLGCSDPNTFEIPLPQALPLAEKPHLLQPTARKEELFGRPRSGAQHPRHQLSSMSLTQRSTYDPPPADNNNGSDDPQSSIGRPNLPPPEKSSKAHPGQAPPPPYSSVIRSTSSFIEKSDTNPDVPSTSSSSSGKAPDPVAMETVSAPGAAVTVDVTSSDNVTAETEVATNSARDEAQSVDDDADDDVATAERVLGKSRLTLELFSRVFLDDVGNESKSILQELGGFEVREAKFRKGTERIRTSQTVDLQLHVERCRLSLIQQTFKSLNQHFKRRCGSTQPMAVLRVKVLFKDEPGEGTGVARSYYTAIAEAILSSEPLPSLDGLLPGTSSSSSRKSTTSMHPLVAHLCKREREDRSRQGGAAAATAASSTAATTASSTATTGSGRSTAGAEQQINLRSFLTARYRDRAPRRGFSSGSGALTPMTTTSVPYHRRALSQRGSQSSLERSKQAIGERLYPKVAALHQTWAPKITGMLLGLPAYELLLLLRSELALQERVSEAVEQLVNSSYNPDAPPGGESRQETSGDVTVTSSEFRSELASGGEKSEEKTKKVEKVEEPQHESLCGGPPLFYQPGKRGFYAPTSWGEMTEARQNAFRNVGRIIGLCLLQNELCPLPLCRHVLKVILGRKVNWHDLAFFDPVLYESLRQLVLDAEGEDGGVLEELELTFQVDLQSEEGGRQVSLIADGATTSVTRANVRDYVRRYALQRMVVCCRKPLEKLRQGVLDVLPRYVFQALTAEDLRLLVNGCGHVDVRTLISYTLFNDESGKSGSADKLVQFKRWFWGVVHHLGAAERQELLYFWTGSPSLPASEDGFQPMPTITIRPPDDQHLPSANTCISRLYVPLYTSRQILKQKLSLAIKTKNFGFV